jgi:hypothetical protein
MSFLVYAALVIGGAILLFMILDAIEAILHFGIVLGAILLLASYDGTKHYFEARGIDSDLAVGRYLETALKEKSFDVTDVIRRQYEAARSQGLVPDLKQMGRDAKGALRELTPR